MRVRAKTVMTMAVVGLMAATGFGCDRDATASGSGAAGATAVVEAKGGSIAGTGKTADGRALETFEVEYNGHVTGKLTGYDANGNLMSGVDGAIEGKNGTYRIKVPDGQYYTRAMVKVAWQGRPFCFRLDPADGEKESKRVEVTSSSNFYGGVMELDMNVGYLPERNKPVRGLAEGDADAEVEFTLTPKGKLIDGSDGKTIVEKMAVKRSGTYSACIRGIPIGVYSVTAKIMSAGNRQRAAKLSLRGVEFAKDNMTGNVAWKDSVELLFDTPYDGVLRDRGARPVRVYVGG